MHFLRDANIVHTFPVLPLKLRSSSTAQFVGFSGNGSDADVSTHNSYTTYQMLEKGNVGEDHNLPPST